ncbi:DUF6188 family protein [Curtobacterium sp. MCJR17_043]|uniref:DUF6188 family protein n=1 Tax=Curtobacterium sp. MCJR17_043 TaxID=2175660 RepID=UPI0024DF6F67|nr:DUF6188 family protein [Curtobacterium sp. MCJR17_043]WIB34895.1 DUF6188 family protein [Curtobacterium sp. MCJR17_043]
MTIPPLRWLVTDLNMVVLPDSDINVLEWEQKVRDSSGAGLWITDDDMRRFVRYNHQMIDGEFFGSPIDSTADDASQAMVRIDFFDSTTVTVTLDRSVIGTSWEFDLFLGPGVPASGIGSRDEEIADEQRRAQEARDGQQIRALVRACLQNARIDEAPALLTQLDAVVDVTPSGPRAWSLALERDDAPRVDLPRRTTAASRQVPDRRRGSRGRVAHLGARRQDADGRAPVVHRRDADRTAASRSARLPRRARRRRRREDTVTNTTSVPIQLHLAGDTVDAVTIDTAVTVRFSSGATLRFETAFSLTETDGTHTFMEPGDPPSLLPLLALHTTVVERGTVTGARIAVRFASGALLEGWSHRDRPSWHWSEPGRARLDIDVLTGGEVVARTLPGGTAS